MYNVNKKFQSYAENDFIYVLMCAVSTKICLVSWSTVYQKGTEDAFPYPYVQNLYVWFSKYSRVSV